jgi:hypothetical protein
VIAEYLKLIGKRNSGRFRTGIATGVGAALAESVVAQFLNAETLLDFLNKGSAKDGAKISTENAPFSGSSWHDAWRVWWHSEYGLANFCSSMAVEAHGYWSSRQFARSAGAGACTT